MTIDLGIDDALETISKVVEEGKCILFLGAGAHVGPPTDSSFVYPEQHRPPRGEGLSRALARQCRLTHHYAGEQKHVANLSRVALFYELGRSRHQLMDAVTASVEEGKRPSPMLLALAKLDFPLILTTNYDTLFEQALEQAGKSPRVVIHSWEKQPPVDLDDLAPERPIVFKLHGDVTKPETIVITDDDYIEFVRQMSEKEGRNPIPVELKECLTQQPMLFLGYSLVDYNLRLLLRTLRLKADEAVIPDMYSVDLMPDELIRDVWQHKRRYLRFIVEDVWRFVPDLYERVRCEELQP